MEDLSLGRIEALVPEFAVTDLALGRTLMMIFIETMNKKTLLNHSQSFHK